MGGFIAYFLMLSVSLGTALALFYGLKTVKLI
ncbi:hypothetical protein GS597_14170 [Synechococcales cyanobacterium C]|uniref:Cytochrome b6-f complex subunit 6 n=1 Tax=Petrachloros mirabilis ULC683 TaxID=2781853 RepID=A0A8K2A0Q8_9CYAN|nr:hypothetical protein [Petrachloros mirabilis]NCJ07633.1 hypothetical protein [Petrachloros mirabilis ULC683]